MIFAVAVIAILIVVVVASAYVVQNYNATKPLLPGVQVGDVFYYNITTHSALQSANANPDEEYPGFSDLNNTNYYQVSVTGINGSVVSLNTDWVFNNGTSVSYPQTIDVASGNLGNMTGFWGLYAANLGLNEQLTPGGTTSLIVNSTSTQTYASGVRDRNNWSTQNVFQNINDPTGSTQQNNYMSVYFDKQTGIMTTMTSIMQFNNPPMTIVIIWQITSSSEWQVS